MGPAHAAHTVCAGEDLEGCGVLLRPPRAADANGLARAEAFAPSSLLGIQAGLLRGVTGMGGMGQLRCRAAISNNVAYSSRRDVSTLVADLKIQVTQYATGLN